LKLKEEINNVLKVKITEINDNGLVVEHQAVKGFIANSETNTAKGTKLADVFAVGAEIDARLLEVERNKVRFSIKAIENQDKEHLFAQYKKQERANASSNKLGSFADLLKGLQIK
jgi:ribosomal protein S1